MKIIKFRRHVSQPERRYTITVAKLMKQLLIEPVTLAHFLHHHDAIHGKSQVVFKSRA